MDSLGLRLSFLRLPHSSLQGRHDGRCVATSHIALIVQEQAEVNVGAGLAHSYSAQGPSPWGCAANIHSEWVCPLQLT